MSIEIDQLSFTYSGSDTKVLNDITISIPQGAFFGLVGPSGCGKTTLARCLNGLIPHFHPGVLEGSVIVQGLNSQDHQAHELAQKVGLVFQNPENQLVAPTVERELAFGPENLGVPREEIRHRVETLLQQHHLEDLRDKAPYELSGGEQQRVAIAAVLALQPDILVLDEPTANLDPLSAFEILQLIAQLNQTMQLTVLLIEHRLELVLPHIQELLVLDQGTLIAKGPPGEVFNNPQVSQIGVAVPPMIQLLQQIENPQIRSMIPLSVEDALRTVLKEVRR
ncbi:MAG: energy-coupling factor ABC transporter ATP-binding protein [Candidatus Hermodarchaeia archaeon]